ncbi:nifU-like N-terminal domain-containing protein [Zea mays]|uniref:Iron-sulfur cluster assembly protein n=2 Tax=Zea mays TaxID=4577 RepID=B4FN02_MAIZE|nr:nifU-like N-terminal domain-containing protein [Zea mays]ACF83495.1 unknown [Zea mays]ONM39542.1 Iron-sulfur cluster assembly protein 1 [Zea mays]
MLRAGGRRLLAPGLRRLGLGTGASGEAGPAAAAAGVRAYHERVVDHYNNPRNVGSFDKDDPNVGTGLVGAPACGDVMKLQIRVDENSGKIVDACFKTFGCGSAIASSSVATEWVKGKPMDEVLTIKNTEIAKHLSLPPVKLHCSMLAEDAIKAAVKDYEAKKSKMGQKGEDSPSEKAAEA